MVTKEVAQSWANLYHNKYSILHDIELGVLHEASAGNFSYKYECPELYQRAITQSLTREDLNILQKLSEHHYTTSWENGGLIVIFG